MGAAVLLPSFRAPLPPDVRLLPLLRWLLAVESKCQKDEPHVPAVVPHHVLKEQNRIVVARMLANQGAVSVRDALAYRLPNRLPARPEVGPDLIQVRDGS